jgi:hypothetical protein
MESFVDAPLVALGLVTLVAAAWAATTRTRPMAWALTAALLWLGTASFVASALLGTPLALLGLGWVLSVAASFAGAYALFGLPGRLGGRKSTPLDVRHVVNSR